MAVHTPVSDADIAGFLAAYPARAVGALIAAAPIAEGIENTNYRLTCANGGFVLTLFERRTDPAALPFIIALQSHLAAHGAAVPAILAGADGARLRTLAGRPALLTALMPGRTLDRPTPALCRDAGARLGALHRAANGFADTRPNPFGPAAWRALADDCTPGLAALETGLDALVADSLDRVARGWPDALPTGPIHADLFPDNALADAERITAFIDFGFACTDAFAYDLAVMHAAWCFVGGTFDSARGQALCAGYAAARPLTPAERTALPLLAEGACLRFLLTRVQDWFAPDTPEGDTLVTRKDPLEFAARLRFYRSLADAGDMGA